MYKTHAEQALHTYIKESLTLILNIPQHSEKYVLGPGEQQETLL